MGAWDTIKNAGIGYGVGTFVGGPVGGAIGGYIGGGGPGSNSLKQLGSDALGVVDPATGYNTAAAGARAAQQQANALSGLQWDRQMQGLGQAQGYVQNMQGLYNSLYGGPGGAQAAGGASVPMVNSGLTPPPGAPPAANPVGATTGPATSTRQGRGHF